MQLIRDELKKLCCACGVAGQKEIAETAMEMLRPLTDSCALDAMGNVLAIRKGTDPHGKTVLLEAHLDEIGFFVTDIDDLGFVHVTAAGGIDSRVLAAQAVMVHGKEVYYGIFCSVPPHLIKNDSVLPSLEDMGIDVGMTAEKARACIPLGSCVSFAPAFEAMGDTTVSAKALDDRAGVAAILHCLRKLPSSKATVAIALSTQEELGCRGAGVAARQLCPDMALVTDVSFACANGENPRQCGKLGEGPMVGISPILQDNITDKLLHLAADNTIPVQFEVMGGSTGTDADTISKELTGIPTGLLSIPLRYMHTPVEMADLRDVAAVGELMAAFIREVGDNG